MVEPLSELEDPRRVGKVAPRLADLLVIAVCAVIACAESWDDIALYGRSKEGWLRRFLDLPNGIPSHDTFRRVFLLIDPKAFERRFRAWTRTLTDEAIDREGGWRSMVRSCGAPLTAVALRRRCLWSAPGPASEA